MCVARSRAGQTSQTDRDRAFSGEYAFSHGDGVYERLACGNELFGSEAKFESGTGWPSLTEPTATEAVELRPDNGLLMRRTEVLCSRCGSHLGHVFDDWTRPERSALLHQLRCARRRERRR